MGQLPARAILQITGVVADTHALIWYLLDDPQLSRRAGTAFDAATAAGHKIYLPIICIVEATYLVEKKRIAEEAFLVLEQVFEADLSPFELVSLTPGVAQAVRQIPRDTVPDLPDRVIAPENGVSPITAFGPPSVQNPDRKGGDETVKCKRYRRPSPIARAAPYPRLPGARIHL